MGIGYVNGVIVGLNSSVNGITADGRNGEGINVDGVQINICYEYAIINIGRPPSTFDVDYVDCDGTPQTVIVSAGDPPRRPCARYDTVSRPSPDIRVDQGPQC